MGRGASSTASELIRGSEDGHGPSLAPASRAIYRAMDLGFHDLRHEAGSRWLEAGLSLHHVKDCWATPASAQRTRISTRAVFTFANRWSAR